MVRALYLISLALLLAACSEQDPRARFDDGCYDQMQRRDGVDRAQREAFCTCLERRTATLPEDELLTFGAMMQEAPDGVALYEALLALSPDGRDPGVRRFASALRLCSFRLVG